MVLRPNHQSNRRFQRGGVDRGPVFSKHAWGIDLEISWDLFLLPSIKWLNPIPHLFWWKSGIPLSFGEIAGSSVQEEEQENAFTRDDESAVSSSSAISYGILRDFDDGFRAVSGVLYCKRLDDCHLGFWNVEIQGNPWIFPLMTPDRICRCLPMDSVTVRQANPWRAQVLSDAPKEEGEVGKEMMVLWI